MLSRRPTAQIFQTLLFSKIVPNCKKLGLLDAADGWLREKFTELGVIEFEDLADTGEEYDGLQRRRPTRSPVGPAGSVRPAVRAAERTSLTP